MLNLLPAQFRVFTLRVALTGILLLVVLPTFIVVGMSLRQSVMSFQEMSRLQLLETARILARSTEGELDTIDRLLLARSELPIELRERKLTDLSAGIKEFVLKKDSAESWEVPPDLDPEISALLRSAITRNEMVVSNIVELKGSPSTLHILVAVPVPEESDDARRVMLLQGQPSDLVRPLQRNEVGGTPVVFAITDGNGRLIARSVGGEELVGRRVPDWDDLKAIGARSGSFRAKLVEGDGVMIAFQEVSGTPGWMAVMGEPLNSFDARWKSPVLFMILSSFGMILLGLAVALMLARTVLAPIRGLVLRAQKISSGEQMADREAFAIEPSPIREFEALRNSLDAAAFQMMQRVEDAQAAEERAHENLRNLQEAERQARIGSWALDLETGTFSASEMMNVLNGRGADAPPLPLEELEHLVPPADFKRIQEAIGRCIETGESYAFQANHLRKDGSSFPVWLQGQALRGQNGKVIKVAGSMQDISERAEQNARLTALADNLPRGAILRIEYRENESLLITYVSGGIEELSGRTPAEIINDPVVLASSVHEDDRDEIIQLLMTPVDPGTQVDRQFRLISADQSHIWVRARVALRVPSPGWLVWDGIILDISAERAAADALRDAKQAAETAERAKSDFLATMSHEIRTPMNSIVGMTRLALKTELEPRQRTYLEKINGSASVLLGIINDILDFSRIEAGGMHLEKAPFRLESILDTVSSVNALRAEEKGLELTFNVAPDVPERLHGDSLRLGQVLTNLVGNAIKFTESGDVEVSIRCIDPLGSDPFRLQFSVRDTGIGLSEKQISGLFKPFVQANSDTARIYGGTGLGLAICQRLVGLMHGRISVESKPGMGSTFTFTAEFGATADPLLAAGKSRNSHSGLHGKRVLVVDDNETARTALAEMILSFGMSVAVANGGEMALHLLHEQEKCGEPFDILLLDWRMPIMDGLELARLIRNDQTLNALPAILMVSAYGHQIVLSEAGDIGLQGVLLKPVTQSVIFNTLLHALVRDDPELREIRQPENSELSIYASRLAGRKVLIVDDNGLNREVASEFLNLVGVLTETAADGREAINRLKSEEFDAVLMDVHMPVMNGLEAIREIRSHSEWLNLPVIALTAQASPEDEAISKAAGMNGHLTKPIDENLLYQKLADLLPLGDLTSHEVVYDYDLNKRLSEISERFGGSQSRVSRFIKGFLRDFSSMSEVYAELERAGDLNAMADFAHRVRGVVGYVRADALYELSGKIEVEARNGQRAKVVELSDEFHHLMKNCVSELQEISGSVMEDTPPPKLASNELLLLAEAAIPLVRKGDFAGRGKIETLLSGVDKTELVPLVESILNSFDDLDLRSTEDGLSALAEKLREMG